ncbi:MAG TPA: FAD-binding oxidoreductase [Acidimicrobiales bacterium]
MAPPSSLRVLDDDLDGHVLLPGDPGYDEARTVWNAMIDRRPRLIVRAASVGDVVTAVRTARELDLELGIRCGGHSVVGQAVPEDGLMLDLTPFGAVRVDPTARRAWVQGGALLGALDAASQPHGLATTAGNVSHTGVGGLTLGGGMGWLARQYGLSCDNVVSFELVTAAGEMVRASADENPELFWGLRGGGGNFGVVTEFEFVLHPVGTQALLVELDLPVGAAGAAEVVRGWRDLSETAPRAATFTLGITTDDDGREVVTVGYVWVGDPDEGQALLPALRALGPAAGVALEERVRPMTYLDLQRIDDTVRGHEKRRYWKGHYLRSLPDEAVDLLLARGVDRSNGDAGGTGGDVPVDLLPNVSLQAYGGAIAEVPDDATAFSHRATRFEFVASKGWTDPADDAAVMAAARRCAAAIEPFASGVYVNVLSDEEGETGVRRAYPPAKLARLVALKDRYDPDNVFHLNHNIRPSAGSTGSAASEAAAVDHGSTSPPGSHS